MTQRAVFFDRDGTLHVERDFCRTPSEVVVFPAVPEALRELRHAGYRIVVVTNQSGVARGFLDETTLARIHDEIQRQVGGVIDAFFHCPHLPPGEAGPVQGAYVRRCPCRKPGSGLLRDAIDLLDLATRGSWVVGDSARDLLAARDFPIGRVLVRSGKPVEPSLAELSAARCEPDAVVDDLAAAVRFVLGSGPTPRQDDARAISAPRA